MYIYINNKKGGMTSFRNIIVRIQRVRITKLSFTQYSVSYLYTTLHHTTLYYTTPGVRGVSSAMLPWTSAKMPSTHTNIHASTHTHTHTHKHAHKYKHTHTHTYTYTRTHTHTHDLSAAFKRVAWKLFTKTNILNIYFENNFNETCPARDP